MPSRDSTIITFAWNTTGYQRGENLIRAYAGPVPGEVDVSDNTFTDGIVTIVKDTITFFYLTPNPAYIGQTVTLQGNLIDEYNQPVKNSGIEIYSNGTLVGLLKTNSTGGFKAGGNVGLAGTYEIKVSFNGSTVLRSCSHTQMLTVLTKLNTKVSFNLSPNPVKLGQTITLTGNLTNQLGSAISNAPVVISYSIDNGVNWIYAGTLQTNSTGGFKATGKLTIVGIFLVKVSYKGSFKYNPSSHIETLTINP